MVLCGLFVLHTYSRVQSFPCGILFFVMVFRNFGFSEGSSAFVCAHGLLELRANNGRTTTGRGEEESIGFCTVSWIFGLRNF